MKIVKIETAWISIPCNPPQGVSSMTIQASTDTICRITTDEGIVGIGEGRGAAQPEICRTIMEEYSPLLLGENPLYSQELWNRMYSYKLGVPGRPPEWKDLRRYQVALAAVDLALWDIRARAQNLSVCELLGGKPKAMPAYLSKAFYVDGQSHEEMCDEALTEMKRDGFTHMKMRVGRYGFRDAIERIEAVRKAIGPDIKLAVDVNEMFDYETALQTCRAAEPYDLMWMEEPFHRYPRGNDIGNPNYDRDNFSGILSRQTSIPLSAGEHHYGYAECFRLITRGCIRYMQYDVTKDGGVTAWLKVSAACEQAGILMAPHHVPHFHIMLNAAVPNGFIMECYDNKRQHPAWPHLFDGFPTVKNGMMDCPKGPGWGMSVNEDFLRKHGHLYAWG